jgi:hypothetical protein
MTPLPQKIKFAHIGSEFFDFFTILRMTLMTPPHPPKNTYVFFI